MQPSVAMIALAAALFAALYLVAFCYRGASWPKSIVKTSSVALLAVGATLAGAWGLGAALALCAAGDYLLSRESENTFLIGVGAFAAGHLVYIALFLSHAGFSLDRLMSGGRGALALLLIALACGMAVVLFRNAGALRFAVLGYVPIVASMGIFALGMPDVEPVRFVTTGALWFVVSDFILALEMFVLAPNSRFCRVTPFAVWITYWFAQLAIFVGLT